MKTAEHEIRDRGMKYAFRILALLIIVTTFAVAFVPHTSANDGAPALGIEYHNLSFSDYTYVYYAVSFDGIDPTRTRIRMLFWYEEQDDGYVRGTEAYETESRGVTEINGEYYAVFRSEGIAPKYLTRTIYARAYAVTASDTVYSEPNKYSPVEYLYKYAARPNAAKEDIDISMALINYGAAAQVKFGCNTDLLATETFCDVHVDNAHLADGFNYGYCKQGTVVTLISDMPSDGHAVRWYDDLGEYLGTGEQFDLVLDRDVNAHPVIAEEFDLTSAAGRRFAAADQVHFPCFLTASPMTIEAAINLPASYSGRGGVILGNYASEGGAFNLEIYTGGKVRLYFAPSGSSAKTVLFDTDVRGGGIRHIAVTIPEAGGMIKLYIDGQLAEQKEMPCAIPFVRDELILGGDLREGNTQYFKGTLYSLALFRGERSAEQIAGDALYVPDAADGKLINAYYFYQGSETKGIVPGGKDLIDSISGLSFADISDRLSLTKTFDSVPMTYEAIIDCDADVSNQKGCTIVGNYNDMYVPGVTFRVYLNGRPSLCLRYDYDHQDQFTLPQSILGAGKVHVAFSIDEKYVYGYLNGELMLKKAHCGYMPELVPYPFSVGGDNRTDNTWWFRNGSIYSIDLYSGYRCAEQIARDMNRSALDDPTLMLSFDFERSMEDRSRNNNELVPYFYDDEFTDPDTYDYTFACIGDTQSLVKYYPDEVHNIYDFILDNADDLKIERVIGLGDMTDDNTHEQWQVVSEEVFRLDGIIPYTVIRGNHDHYARTPEAEATKELMFGYYFDNDTYRAQYDGSYDGTPANTYKRFTAGGVPYLLLCLDYGPDDDVLAWASSVVEQYPNDNVIIVTHAFLFHDTTTIDENDTCPPRSEMGSNNCDEMWDKFVSKYENIVLVLCGHDPSNEVVVSRMKGEHGNTVTSMLINPQHTDYYDRPSGLVALLHFSNGGSTITVENYSTVEGKFYKTCNRFTVDGVAVVTP